MEYHLALQFLRDELTRRKEAVQLLEDGNNQHKGIASKLSTIYIKDGVSTIDKYQFDGCKNVRNIILPFSVESIDHTAFNFLPKLESVHLCSNKAVHLTPSSPTFGVMLTNTVFFVPMDIVEEYKTKPMWKNIADRVIGIDIK